MRIIAAFLVAVACLQPRAASGQDAYAAVLLQYVSADADLASLRLLTLDRAQILDGIEAFDTTRAPMVLTGAAAMHTEAAIRRGGVLTGNFQLQVATAIVEFGEASGKKSNSTITIHPQHARPVSDSFRRLWYCTVITALENSALAHAAGLYLDHALALYPSSPEIQLLAGVAAEMRHSPRTPDVSAGDRRKALEAAEQHYRAVIAVAPDRLEARLRLGRVLQERGQLPEARALLEPLTKAEDRRITYLALLFLGGIEDAAQHYDAALAAYAAASSRAPTSQAARLAASELQHRLGDRQTAADIIPAAAGEANVADPWWTYVFGEHWRIDILVNALRGMRRA